MANIANQATITPIIQATIFADLLVDGDYVNTAAHFTNLCGIRFTFSEPKTVNKIRVYPDYGGAGYLRIKVDGVQKWDIDDAYFYPSYAEHIFSPAVVGTVFDFVLYLEGIGNSLSEIEIFEEAPAGYSADFSVDTERILSAVISADFNADIERRLSAKVDISADTERRLSGQTNFYADTLRKRSSPLSGYSKLSIELKAKTISDRFTIIKPVEMAIGDTLRGNLKDFSFDCSVIKTSDSKGIWTVSAAYAVEDLMRKPLAISHQAHQSGIANALLVAILALGKTPSVNIDNFYARSIGDSNPTYKDAISFWVGWTDKIPHKQINIFQRGNVIHALQRGKEASTYTIQKSVLTNRTREKIYTLQSRTNTSGTYVGGELVGDISETPTYRQGTVTFGDSSITYLNGLVIHEQHINNSGVLEETEMEYSSSTPPARLLRSTTTIYDPEGVRQTIVTYSYSTIDEVYYLSKETETEYDKDGNVSTQRVTRHFHLGQDDWGTIVEVDGVTVAKSIGQGAPSSDAVPYTIRQNSMDISTSQPSVSLPSRLINDITIPVTDLVSLHRIAADLTWLDGKIEEKVSLDVYDDHILDFTEKIFYDGNTYYLDSNTVSHTISKDKSIFVQAVQLVRWY